jgi:histidinol-phosphate aminotransferase
MRRRTKPSKPASAPAAGRIPARVRNLHAYVPGEQPRIRGLIKLNTNENPFGPSPRVLEAIRKAADERLRLYPDPVARQLRERLAAIHGCQPENIIVGNGSDDLLTVATRTFVQPRGLARSPSAETVQFFSPGYSLYPVLAGIHGARIRRVALRKNFALPALPDGRAARGWDPKAALTFVTTPNAPSGRGYATRELDAWCRDLRGVVVLDEAYADFAAENAMQLAIRHPHVLVSRTFSKAYSLCYLSIG